MVPFVDLKAQYRAIEREIVPAVTRVLESASFVLGEEVRLFEQEFATYCNARHAVAVNTGASALHLTLLAAGVGPGDEVITVPNTFVATVAAIDYTGARAVLVDIDPDSFNIDPNRLEDAINPRTKVILPVHLYGRAADMDPIMEVARRHGLHVIEDAAQAHGGEYKGRRLGSIGDLGCFSFYPGKNLGAYGEGGAVVTNNPAFERDVRMRRDWGAAEKYHHVVKGFNYRMDGIQGAILRVKLRHLEEWTEARRARAARYDRLLASTPYRTPSTGADCRHVYHVYAIRSNNRDAVQAKLRDRGVQTGIHYPIPVHLQPAYSDLGYKAGAFPHAELAAREVLSLPMFPELSEEQQNEVVAALAHAANDERSG